MNAVERIDGGALSIYAKLLAESIGVELVIGGQQPCTDGKTIYLPDLDQTDPVAKAVAYGMITHENGHIQDSSFLLNYAAAGITQDVPASLQHLVDAVATRQSVKKLSNSLEDIRIEHLAMRKYPGARARLQFMVTELLKQGYWTAPDDDSTPGECLRTFVGAQMRTSVLKQKGFENIATTAYKLCLKHLPATAMRRLGGMLLDVIHMRSTEEVVELALRIEQMLKDEAEKDPQQPQPTPPQQPQGEGGQGVQDGQQQGNPAPDDKSGGNNASQSGGNQPGNPQLSPENNGAMQGPGEGKPGGSSSGDQGSQQQRDNLKKILSGEDSGAGGEINVGETAKSSLGSLSRQSAGESIHLPEADKRTHGLGTTAAIMGRITQVSNALRRKATNLLEAQAINHTFYQNSGSRIDPRKIPNIGCGDLRIFEHEEEGVKLNTAIMVLLDNSSSMNCGAPSRISIASDAVLATYTAFSSVKGVRVGAGAFPYHVGNDKGGVQVLADIGENFRTAAPRFVGINAKGSTPMAEAMLWGGYQLMACKEERKILFVATDGAPDSNDKSVSVIKMLRKMGIEVMALGIASDAAKDVFGNSAACRIEDISDMAGAMFSMLKGKLLKRAA